MADAQQERKRFIEYTMAERLTDEAEGGIKAQPRAAWPLAEVIARIFVRFPVIEELFHALMFKACPYLIPDFSGSEIGNSLAPGQRQNESFNDFAGRMVSYHRLWFAVAVTQGNIGVAWCWLARILNSNPTAIVAPLLHATLEMVGSDAQARYKKQFTKLTDYVLKIYMAELQRLQDNVRGEEADQVRASLSRLKRWLDSASAGRPPPPEGRVAFEARCESEQTLNPNI